jgi:excisionase family DNA binding protein
MQAKGDSESRPCASDILTIGLVQNIGRVTDILTIMEVAVALRCSRAHVYNLVAGRIRGVQPLPVIALGRRKLIRRSSLENWKRTNERVFTNGMLPPSPDIDAADA